MGRTGMDGFMEFYTRRGEGFFGAEGLHLAGDLDYRLVYSDSRQRNQGDWTAGIMMNTSCLTTRILVIILRVLRYQEHG